MKPILLRRSVRTTAGLPELEGESCDVVVSERADVSGGSRLRVPMSVLRLLQGLP